MDLQNMVATISVALRSQDLQAAQSAAALKQQRDIEAVKYVQKDELAAKQMSQKDKYAKLTYDVQKANYEQQQQIADQKVQQQQQIADQNAQQQQQIADRALQQQQQQAAAQSQQSQQALQQAQQLADQNAQQQQQLADRQIVAQTNLTQQIIDQQFKIGQATYDQQQQLLKTTMNAASANITALADIKVAIENVAQAATAAAAAAAAAVVSSTPVQFVPDRNKCSGATRYGCEGFPSAPMYQNVYDTNNKKNVDIFIYKSNRHFCAETRSGLANEDTGSTYNLKRGLERQGFDFSNSNTNYY